jgi:hypothetical protein
VPNLQSLQGVARMNNPQQILHEPSRFRVKFTNAHACAPHRIRGAANRALLQAQMKNAVIE